MSNRLEQLLAMLGNMLDSAPLTSPLDQETFVIQSLGMQKWLSLRLAERLGVWANCRYQFPNSFINGTFDAITGKTDASPDFFNRDAMTWAIMRHLPRLAGEQGFESIHSYLGEVTGSLKLWQLASRIAHSLDQYLTYRPDIINSWDAGDDLPSAYAHIKDAQFITNTRWQALLWRNISKDAHGPHRARRLGEFLSVLAKKGFSLPEGFPQRISVFGIPALPPFHLEVLSAIAHHVDVHIFFLNPSREFWGDISSPSEQSRAAKKTRPAGVREKDLHLERGHGFLSSTGKMGRDFFDQLIALEAPQPQEMFDDDMTPGNGILRIVQDDILNLRDRGAAEPPVEVDEKFFSRDRTLVINSCHGPMREVEVLRDYLLDLFSDRDAAFSPDEILVLTPDIEIYAPYIEAVFGTGEPRIPYSVADRAMRHESALAGIFLALLDVAPSRFEASRIADLLEHRLVRRRFGIEDEDLSMLRRWIIDTRINWSFDETGKEKLALPAIRENTWKAGLDRMLLGYAMPGKDVELFHGILPYDNIEGGDALLLGKIARFVRELHECAESLLAGRTLHEWRDALSSVLEKFILAGDDSINELRGIEEVLAGLSVLADATGFDGMVDFRTIRAHLDRAFGESISSRSFMSGGVTFCAMLPMRSIPFRAICMIGMNDAAFPRQDRVLPFDLMAAAPRPGDRSLREEDRYLFLEALISARERLYISYTGQSIADSGEIPPSILVSELIDCIEQTFAVKGAKPGDLRTRLVAKHPLQPFSPRYFGGGLFSYSRENCEASGMMHRRETPRPFIEGKVSAAPRVDAVDLSELLSFFDNPARHLLRRSLNIRLVGDADELSDSEPFDMRGLDRYGVEDDLCRARVLGDDVELLARSIRSAGRLPHGTPGELALRDVLDASGAIAARVMKHAGGNLLPPLGINLVVDEIPLRGAIGSLWSDAHVRYRPAYMKAKDLLRGWILHLALSLCRGESHPSRTVIIARKDRSKKAPGTVVFPAMDCNFALGQLSSLMRTFLRGGGELISLMPECSLAFAREMHANRDLDAALSIARQKWEPSPPGGARGESADPYFDLCFGRLDDDARFGKNFIGISGEIFFPILSNSVEVD